MKELTSLQLQMLDEIGHNRHKLDTIMNCFNDITYIDKHMAIYDLIEQDLIYQGSDGRIRLRNAVYDKSKKLRI